MTGKGVTPAKISSPRGNRPVPRPRLFERLDELRQAPLVWVAAAPGAGKTTLASSYLAARGLAHLWLQLDADDADIASFFYYLGLAVRHASARDDLVLPTMTPEYLPGLTRFTRRYAEALAGAVDAPALLVLDNAEALPEQAALHEVVRQLAAALPPGWTVLVLSRADPPASYARLRLHEGLRLLGGAELNLTADEGRALAAAREPLAGVAGVAGAAADSAASTGRIERLLEHTHGWLAGFTLLLAEGAQGASRPTEGDEPWQPQGGKSQQLLFDYFATELFERFEPALQAALLCTAPLPTMTAADAAALSGEAGIGPLLADLHRRNCFVAQRDGGAVADGPAAADTVYEYHTLFRAFLLDRAVAFFSADAWRVLQNRAADLLAEARQPDAAAGLYHASGHVASLAALALREAPALIRAGRHRTLSHWLSGLPNDAFQRAPWLSYWRATARLPFEPVAARADFELAYEGLRSQDDAVGLYSTWAGAMESFFFEWRDFYLADRWIAEWEQLRQRHPQFPSRAVELRTYWAMGTLLHRQPQHPLLPAWAERALALLDKGDRDLSVLIGGFLIIWFLWRGETPKARGVIERIGPWIAADMSPMVFILWCCALALHHSVQGALDACRQAVQDGLAMAHRTGLQGFDFLFPAQLARGCLIAGEITEAETWMAAMGTTMHSHSHTNGAFYRHLHCNAAAQRGNWQQALAHAREGMAMALESGVPFLVAHCHIDLARALLGGKDHAEPGVAGVTDEWAAHIAAAGSIGKAIGSRVINHLCLESQAQAAFDRGDDAQGLAHLAEALALSRAMDGPLWQMDGPQATARLYQRALLAGIETDHVQQLIRRRRLSPPEPATAADDWPWPIRLYTLGRFEVLRDEQPLRSSGKVQHKPLELLKCLCAFGGQAVNQDRITDALWPDTNGDAADQALRTTLHRLRKLLGEDRALRLEDRHLHLDPRFVWADCLAFDRAAHHPRITDRAALQRALSRYRGVFLPGESARWAMAFRERLRAQHRRMAEQLCALLEAAGDWQGVADGCARVIDIEPEAEAFYRRQMQACVQLGRRSEALAVYQRCRLALLSRLGISPTPETQALYAELGGR